MEWMRLTLKRVLVTPFEFLCHALATWYISYILTAQNGPFAILVTIRAMPAFYELLQCIYCVAPYIAAGVYVIGRNSAIGYPVVQVLAVAGAALMLRSYTGAGVHNGL
jgi:hypothetical protein